jgi:hypothetical protein
MFFSLPRSAAAFPLAGTISLFIFVHCMEKHGNGKEKEKGSRDVFNVCRKP